MSQTQRMPGYTSQSPLGLTPPHGPLRSCLGQVIGQAYAVAGNAHWPHILQPNRRDLTTRSAQVKALYSGGDFISVTEAPYHSGLRRSSTTCSAFMTPAGVRGRKGWGRSVDGVARGM